MTTARLNQYFGTTELTAIMGGAVIPGIFNKSVTDGITAHAGGGQPNAVPLVSFLNRVSTVGTAADSVVLPPSVAGMEVVVMNGAAANSMNCFPAGTDAINALGASAAFAMTAGTVTIFFCFTAGQWFTK